MLVFGVGGLVMTLRAPILNAEGTVAWVKVHHGKSSSTYLVVRADDGSALRLSAGGTSLFFRVGEHVRIRYRSGSGAILHATFVSASGTDEGMFRDFDTLIFYGCIGMAGFVAFASWKKHQRDPEDDERRVSAQPPLTGVDDDSLLHLSHGDSE